MPQKKFPYENLSLVNLPKEKWKDIPGFEGHYMISNYGRVKSVSRQVAMKTPYGGVYMTRERILKASLAIKKNKVTKDNLYTLKVSLSKEGILYHIQLARYVYYMFKERFDLKNFRIFISQKNRDGRNIHVSNLIKTNMQAIKLASYREGRAKSHLSKLSKAVTQFDQSGNPVKSFPSRYAAGRALGIGERNITEVVSGPGNMYKGFFWKSGIHTRKLNLKKLLLGGKEFPEVNTSLQKRLGIKRLNKNKIPAYLNLSPVSMKSEVWKDIPGYQNLYQLSNYGRVKALQKVTHGLKKMWMPERIKMLTSDFRKDEEGKESPGALLVTLAKNGKKKTIFVARYVYYLFVKKFKISDSTLRIYYRDGNNLNASYKNLVLKRGIWTFDALKKYL